MSERKTIFDKIKEEKSLETKNPEMNDDEKTQVEMNRSNIFDRVKQNTQNSDEARSNIVTRQKKTVFDNIDQEQDEKESKTGRSSVFDRISEKSIDKNPNKRESFFDRVPEEPKEESVKDSSSRRSVFNRIPDGTKQKTSSNEKKPEKRKSNIDNINPETNNSKRRSVFKEENTPEIEKAMKYIEKHFPDSYKEYSYRLRNMVKKLIPPTISMVSNWGELSIEEQRDLVDRCTDLVRLYNATNIAQLINDIIDNSGYQGNVSFFESLKRNFYKQEEINYQSEAENSKQIINNIISDLDELKAKTEDTIIPLWMVSIAAVDDTYTSDDEALNQSMHSRRMLLKHAYMNVESSRAQLERVRLDGVKMLGELDNVLNVVLPAMKRKKYE